MTGIGSLAAGAAQWLGLIELIGVFSLVLGFCAWEIYRTNRDSKSDD